MAGGEGSGTISSMEQGADITKALVDELRVVFSQEFEAAPLRALGASEHVTVSVVVSRDGTSGREVLLVEHPRWGWAQPGGHLEPYDESLRAAVTRELREETGIELGVGAELRPVLLSTMAVRCGGVEGAHLDVCFHLELEDEVRRGGEHRAQWVPAEVASTSSDRFTAAMVRAALA